MKYISIDLETTGLNHDICNILEFAAVADDLRVQAPIDKLPKFQTYILQDHYIGESYALGMHAEIFKKISSWKKGGINICSPADLIPRFYTFLTTLAGYGANDGGIVKINVAGKNFGNFDSKFLEKLPHHNLLVRFHHRILDPAMLYFDPNEDETLPSTDVCMVRADIDFKAQHTALEDAMNVVKLLRKKYPLKGKNNDCNI
jgi:hypothetical protein